MARSLIAAGILTVLMGCSSHPHEPIKDDPYYAPIVPDVPTTLVVPTGSLFDAHNANELYSDVKAVRVGDIIQVMLTESTSAKKSASNEISRDSTLSVSPATFGGTPITINGNTLELSATDGLDTSREADTDQSNKLSGSISVNVVQKLPNGNLMVRGEKWITINTGEEYIRLTGIIRPRDISPDNTIDSTRIANARIQYSGKGDQADVMKLGWLTKFFLGPLWPF